MFVTFFYKNVVSIFVGKKEKRNKFYLFQMENTKRKYTVTKTERKVVDGDLRNKERTKQKWIDAVGTVLREKGYAGLTVKDIVEKAQMDRRLIALYFGDANILIEKYLNSADYWMSRVAPKFNSIIEQSDTFGKE